MISILHHATVLGYFSFNIPGCFVMNFLKEKDIVRLGDVEVMMSIKFIASKALMHLEPQQ
jgi:hypothetical protein